MFRANFRENPGEVGAACSVYVGGRPVVNLWDGLADREANRPWRKNTIVQVASTTKGATAICAHMLAQRLDVDVARLCVLTFAQRRTHVAHGEHLSGGDDPTANEHQWLEDPRQDAARVGSGEVQSTKRSNALLAK
ncbi:serine hydrolase domain-containing protein [Allorhizocola rhizosphaerae]|uniref:serine hydrolase domain-containing protein n=1 Tax=Allorhizocola rhizosphaerae TaxID=1872709 RepID=UPI001B8CEFC7|nr:serine hydrolase domain-containing protein [Allorhizocola rhizosphaerae]